MIKLVLLIPVYNEEHNIAKIFSLIKKTALRYPNFQINLVFHNDNSKDNTLEKIKLESDNPYFKTTVLNTNTQNLGHGKSLLKLFNFVKENEYDFVVTLDADIKINDDDFIDLFQNFNNKVYIGKRARFKDGIFRASITFLLEIVLLFKLGKFWRDVNCPIRIYPYKEYVNLWKNVPSDSIIPNVHITKLVIKSNINFDRVGIIESMLSKNAGVTWQDKNIFTKYSKILRFCFKALKEIYRN